VRDAAETAVTALEWKHAWHVDADHIHLDTVDRFIPSSDFFAIDVADSIGKTPEDKELEKFLVRHPELIGTHNIAGISEPFVTTSSDVKHIASRYLQATKEAGEIFRHIAHKKGSQFIAEVSMDETDTPQTAPELLIILAALADAGVKAQTIAPKFTGRFNKGVDYVGDLAQFEREFNDDIAVITHAVAMYRLPKNLKLSVHSGSDKFSLYPIIRRALQKTDVGIHIKTAGTTWLEELIGLAEAGGDGLVLVKEIYLEALSHVEELCAPYAAIIDIDRAKLPDSAAVSTWSGAEFAGALRHIPSNPLFNPSFRQLLHVSFKLAAKKGNAYLDLLKSNEAVVAKNVTENLFTRHLLPIFIG
jgi:tagaturonate epimerase